MFRVAGRCPQAVGFCSCWPKVEGNLLGLLSANLDQVCLRILDYSHAIYWTVTNNEHFNVLLRTGRLFLKMWDAAVAAAKLPMIMSAKVNARTPYIPSTNMHPSRNDHDPLSLLRSCSGRGHKINWWGTLVSLDFYIKAL